MPLEDLLDEDVSVHREVRLSIQMVGLQSNEHHDIGNTDDRLLLQ
jgi:hypothetical protein